MCVCLGVGVSVFTGNKLTFLLIKVVYKTLRRKDSNTSKQTLQENYYRQCCFCCCYCCYFGLLLYIEFLSFRFYFSTLLILRVPDYICVNTLFVLVKNTHLQYVKFNVCECVNVYIIVNVCMYEFVYRYKLLQKIFFK